jgi:hypothetical protein
MTVLRRSSIIAAAALGVLIAAPPALAADRLPDLGMGRITD